MSSILIVDDEEKIRNVYKALFKKEGYDVLVAGTAPQAKQILVNRPVNLILLDINMEEVGGEDLYEVVQAFHREAKVIVSSVYPIDDQKDKLPNATDYFDKSEGLTALTEKVRRHLPNTEPRGLSGKILIIDDDPKIRNLWQMLLTKAGWPTTACSDRDNVLEYLKKNSRKIDLILLDLAMSRVSGMDLFEVLRSRYPHIKVIIASNYPVDEQEFMVFDADDYYDKTDDSKILLEKIQRLLIQA